MSKIAMSFLGNACASVVSIFKRAFTGGGAHTPNPVSAFLFFMVVKKLERLGFTYLYQNDRHCGVIPKKSGVYCFVDIDLITKSQKIVYIGKSKDISVRLKPWHRVEHIHPGNWPSCFILLTDRQDEIEIELIRKFKPMYNVHHNPAISRTITYKNGQPIY